MSYLEYDAKRSVSIFEIVRKVVQACSGGCFRDVNSPVVETIARSIKKATQCVKEACDENR
jgi:hypothetical protein